MGSPRPDTDEWLINTKSGTSPSGREQSPPSSGHLESRIESLEREIADLRPRLAEAIEHADLALGLERSLRAELQTMREELVRREQIARQEVLALQKVIADMPGSGTSSPLAGPSSESDDDALVFNRAAAQVEQRVRKIEQRVAAADEVVRTLAPRPDSAANSGSGRPQGVSEPEQVLSELAPMSDRALIDVNRIGFEQLREIGLSVTQAARLLARRDARGEYSSLDQLDDLLDFPRELIDRLKRSLRIG